MLVRGVEGEGGGGGEMRREEGQREGERTGSGKKTVRGGGERQGSLRSEEGEKEKIK